MMQNIPNDTEIFIELLHYYSTKFQRLRVDRSHGIAPHKPILILTILQSIEHGLLKENKIYLNSTLIDLFQEIWRHIGSEKHHPDISKPFFHLRGDKFWHHVPKIGFTKVVNSKVKLKTFNEVYQAIKYAYIDDSLFDLLQDMNTRHSLQKVLARRWFSHRSESYMQALQSIKISYGKSSIS